MRHQNRTKKLGRTAAHRKATLAALASALIEHKRIETTLAKAKALRSYVEPLINRAKEDTTHNRREVFRHLQNKDAIKELFGEVAASVGDRPGGYTRVVKLGLRQGDSAEMAVIELVDFNDVRPEGTGTGKRRTRRGGGRGRRRGGATQQAAPAAEKAQPQAEEATATPPAASNPSGSAATTPEPPAQEPSPQPDDTPEARVHPREDDHPDAPQGGAPGTGEAPPEAGQDVRGRGGEHRG